VNRLGSGGTGEIGLAGFERAESITPARSKSSDYFEQIPGAEHLAQRSASDEFWPSRGGDPHARSAGTAMRMSSRSHTRARATSRCSTGTCSHVHPSIAPPSALEPGAS